MADISRRDDQITIKLTAEELVVVEYIESTYGFGLLRGVLEKALKQQADARRKSLIDIYLKAYLAAPESIQRQIDAILGINQ
jgi:hypothetical protein